ncbi:hypothetical protein QYM36_010821 [Artemia franciscana]|uniref:Platelet-derived growth factor (PDGF) family profile domain-containing protein n=1 Tax=Artemia franciscana TaxID=6661 RepID=A0AA88HWK2_ARTSF|nr:hypothetical protein QYM36_010821 [Artemia franciscana]
MLQAIAKDVPRHDSLCVAGDFNAKVRANRQYCTIANFYEDTSTRTATHPNEIPASLMKRLAEVESLEDLLPFIGNAVEVDIGGMKVIFANSSSDFELITRTAERSNVVRATPANCKPELHTVSLVESLSPSVYYWPTCTRIERCGGCCNSELLVCEPIKKETVLLEITKIEFQRGGRPMRLSGREVIPVEKHLSCKCGCKVKPSDCSEIQVYSVGDCKCDCRNIEAKRICDLDSEKIWDPSRCICFCRKERTCASGFYFDVTSCR